MTRSAHAAAHHPLSMAGLPGAVGRTARPVPAADAPGLAETCCDRWADGSGRLALIRPRLDGPDEAVSFDALHVTSCRIAQVLRAHGIGRRDRVGILLSQGPEMVIALLAAWRLGAIAVPLARMLDGPALAFRLDHAGVTALVTDDAGLAATQALRPGLVGLRLVFGTERSGGGVLSFWQEAGRAAEGDPGTAVAAVDPALILYTAGARGVLHAHRALAANLPGVAAQHGGFPHPGDLVWTPMDWAWRSGLFDALLPALFHGVPVLAAPMPRFDGARALALMARHGVRNAVLPAGALGALHDALPPGPGAPRLRSIATTGAPPEAAPAAAAAVAARLGASLRHAYGTAACNLLLLGGTDPSAAFQPMPGHDVAVVDTEGRALPDGQAGLLAVRRRHPAVCLGTWKDSAPAAPGPWLPTGERATRQADGAILLDAAMPAASGDGMGPADVEHCLRRHPAVALATLVGPADAMAGEHTTAVIVLTGDATPGPALADELRDFMRRSLPGHLTPRRVAFAKALPRAPEGRGALGSTVGLGAQRG